MRFELLILPSLVAVTAAKDLLTFIDGVSSYSLASSSLGPKIWIASNDHAGVKRAAADLAIDFGRVTSQNATTETKQSLNGSASPLIIAGTIGKSTTIDELVTKNKIDVSAVKGKWEAYTSALVENPTSEISWALVIAGSNHRGTIYGLYNISETIGVSPWHYWADVAPKRKTGIWVQDTQTIQKPPPIKYRGFFINDESPGLDSWAKKTFGGSPIFKSAFYKHVFELLLRLKANYLWPAIHHEPMARSEREQIAEIYGGWNWVDNKEEVTEFFRGGARRGVQWDTIYTVGMRGEGDAQSPTLTADALEEVIEVQQGILSDVYNTTDLLDVPQTWVLYKEVGKYFQAGMKVPDDIILLWTDDNSGNIMRTPLANETDRPGGAGIYYHFDYVGIPRNYKWINTIQLIKTWDQMHLAYEKGARSLWIANVGDIKPLEIPTTHFLDMAYDMDRHSKPDSVTLWLKRWATREFGSSIADVTAEILNTYGMLIVRCKYELLSRAPFVYSTAFYDEAENVLQEWVDLLSKTQKAYDSLAAQHQNAYFQMILHPVLAGKTVVELYIKANLNQWRLKQRRTSADKLADDVHRLFAEDAQITRGFTLSIMANGIRSCSRMPNVSYHTENNVPKSGIMGVNVQGSSQSAPGDPEPTLMSMDPYMPPTEKRYLDIFTRKNGTFSFRVTSNVSYTCAYIKVDWSKAPSGISWAGLKVQPINAPGRWNITAKLPVNKTSVPTSFKGYVESGGLVSIEAEHFSASETKNGLSYMKLPHFGRTLSGIKLWPVTAASQTTASAPELTYSFYTFTPREKARIVVFLGASHNHDPSRPLNLAFAVDGGTPVTVQPVPDTPMGQNPSGWTEATVAGGWTTFTTTNIPAGSHKLSWWLLEPGVVVQKVVIDVGGFKKSGLGPPESLKV
ncbi:hypothetical protein FALBO_8244 [Fusarium albosuccineum]|uniref:Gylcosyl hydrolase 115 C-terminal domain-containing protein n=1 Tax=Fusarium albosuccineum TaxID=1237068 RepID=A0A8H4PJH7_9HYPO|nr:hypothetical protein FALBO_8244 [Fusarium albosuccineum]